MPILLILCVKKKKCTAFLVLFWGLQGLGYFLFSVPVLCIDFHNSSKAGTTGFWAGGQFLECTFKTLQKGAHSF